ncbi:MAG: AMP-binding protein [Panacagrimonas sp.]
MTDTEYMTPALRRERLAAAFPAWVPMTISQQLDAMTERYKERPLVITDERSFSYREIREWSCRIAAGLIELGVKARDHVAMVMANYPEFVAVKYAIARVGAVAVPVNFLLRERELRYVLDQSDSVLLITMNRFGDRDYLADLDAIAPGWETNGGGSALPKLRGVVVYSTNGEVRDRALTLESLAIDVSSELETELAARSAQSDPDFRSDIVYTSGTTGHPKGVMLTHEMILRAAYASAYTRALEDGRRILFALPMYHVFGYVECLAACTFVGGAIIPHVSFDATRMIEAAQRHRASEIICVPLMTMKILDVVRERGFDNRHLTTMFNSGGANPPDIWADIRKLLGVREIVTAYGMSETTASTTCTFPEGPDERLLNSNGKLKFAGVAGDPKLGGILAEYKVVDPETGQTLAPGERGELMARGPIVTRGYYNKPEETAAALEPEGWLHTGDVGSVDADGYLVLTGRIKETYRCGGEMVIPREIEELINTHPLVAQSYVVGLAHERMGEIGCVCVVPNPQGRPEPQELIDLCAKNLARFKVPRHVLFVTEAEVPMTVTGRPQKFKLAALAKERLAQSAA